MQFKPNRSSSYRGTFNIEDKADRIAIRKLKHDVYAANTPGNAKRVVLRGREPYEKMKVEEGYFTPASKGPVKYTYHGNLVGGIFNAKVVDVYVYSRKD
jgi:hypothetical protein